MSPRRLSVILVATFSFALVMGPGPGNLLINPDPNDPDATRFVFGMPILYAWALFWFGVQATCVALASIFLWREKANPSPPGESP